jgi:hypothetical protein
MQMQITQIGLRLDAIYGMLWVGLGSDVSCVDTIPRHALFWMERFPNFVV